MQTTATRSPDRAASLFGQMLKTWRGARKVSQLELALHAGTSQRHLSFLESGRARPSREMVLALAESLDVPLRERNALLTAAGFAALYRERSLDGGDMTPVRKALELTLTHHEPYPALVVDRAWNLLMQNEAATTLLGVLGDADALWVTTCGDRPRNMMRAIFHPEGLRRFIVNWDHVGATLLNRLRREATAADSGLDWLIAELVAFPGIPAHWRQADWQRPLSPLLPLVVGHAGLELSLFTMIALFGTPQDITVDELRVETFFPADDATTKFLRQLAART
jgi:transcriptional regulator with XRE-family HTH domain